MVGKFFILEEVFFLKLVVVRDIREVLFIVFYKNECLLLFWNILFLFNFF